MNTSSISHSGIASKNESPSRSLSCGCTALPVCHMTLYRLSRSTRCLLLLCFFISLEISISIATCEELAVLFICSHGFLVVLIGEELWPVFIAIFLCTILNISAWSLILSSREESGISITSFQAIALLIALLSICPSRISGPVFFTHSHARCPEPIVVEF